jgi:predicted nucleotidyltransferase component of viral defense system
VPDRDLVEAIAADLGTRPDLVEKDWHVVRAVGVIAQVETAGMTPAFSGGTSLSKGWELIKRFSEDIDFKVGEPAASSASRARRERTAYRERVLAALTGAGFQLEEKPVSGNESRYFSADLAYGGEFEAGQGLRPHIRVEMSFQAPALPPVARPIRSLVAMAQKQPAEVPSFPCVDPVETAADKLSALAWRVCARDRARPGDDPTIIRHLHDLAALERRVASAPRFAELVLAAAAADIGRGGEGVPSGDDPSAVFAEMLRRLETDPLWAMEYEEFVRQVSFAGPGQEIDFTGAVAACVRLAGMVRRGVERHA